MFFLIFWAVVREPTRKDKCEMLFISAIFMLFSLMLHMLDPYFPLFSNLLCLTHVILAPGACGRGGLSCMSERLFRGICGRIPIGLIFCAGAVLESTRASQKRLGKLWRHCEALGSSGSAAEGSGRALGGLGRALGGRYVNVLRSGIITAYQEP